MRFIHLSVLLSVSTIILLTSCQSHVDNLDCVTDEANLTEFAWQHDTCEAPLKEAESDLRGTWTGTLTYEQTWNGVTDSMEVQEWILEIGDWSAPKRALPALGFVGDWTVYGNGSHFPLSLFTILENGGRGTAYAYNQSEADGPSNRVCMTRGATCATETSFEWQYTAVYKYADLIDYSLYGYADSKAPTVEVDGHDSYTLDGDVLVLEATGIGGSEDGDSLEVWVTGDLVRVVE